MGNYSGTSFTLTDVRLQSTYIRVDLVVALIIATTVNKDAQIVLNRTKVTGVNVRTTTNVRGPLNGLFFADFVGNSFKINDFKCLSDCTFRSDYEYMSFLISRINATPVILLEDIDLSVVKQV